MKVRVGPHVAGLPDYVDRPLRELALEALAAPMLVLVFWRAMRRGWGH